MAHVLTEALPDLVAVLTRLRQALGRRISSSETILAHQEKAKALTIVLHMIPSLLSVVVGRIAHGTWCLKEHNVLQCPPVIPVIPYMFTVSNCMRR